MESTPPIQESRSGATLLISSPDVRPWIGEVVKLRAMSERLVVVFGSRKRRRVEWADAFELGSGVLECVAIDRLWCAVRIAAIHEILRRSSEQWSCLRLL
jgi:hypothetical protein